PCHSERSEESLDGARKRGQPPFPTTAFTAQRRRWYCPRQAGQTKSYGEMVTVPIFERIPCSMRSVGRIRAIASTSTRACSPATEGDLDGDPALNAIMRVGLP